MIIITGALGFIGSCLVRKLNDKGHENLLLVDDFDQEEKEKNLEGKRYLTKVQRKEFLKYIEANPDKIDFIFHIGARTDTTEMDMAIFDELNLNYSKSLWTFCTEHQVPFVYASSAATYGLGEDGYDDNHDIVKNLKPLNPYGVSKNDFDKWALDQNETPPVWIGMKFFNVYGPNEYHKDRMASVIFHTVRQIKATGEMKLFKSHRSDVKDGHQQRDFIYVKDVVDICYFFYESITGEKPTTSGLYNVGTGTARTFLDLANNTFSSMGLSSNITYIDTPEDIRDNYQYYTEAQMDKLKRIGYKKEFYSLERGIQDYVQNYLLEGKVW